MDSLKRHGVKHIFGYPGGAILPIYDELYRFEERGELQHILVRHEQAAAHAADAYARATGKVGVCFGTSGPGATNLEHNQGMYTSLEFIEWNPISRAWYRDLA